MNGSYLDLPRAYCEPLGGLRWSALADAVETADGRTFAVTPQILAFLEGFASRRPLIAFGHVLHFLHLLRQRKTPRHDFTPLTMAWQEAGRPARTAGVVCALLCPEVPVAVNPGTVEELAGWLNVWARVSVRPASAGDEPALGGDAFESLVAAEAASYSYRALVHWFRHGRAPVEEQAEAVAETLIAQKPRSLAEVLARVSRHDRLSGAVPFVSALVGALSLPPRRHAPPEVPIGGFADVTTKGPPEAILAGQFALDEWEFLRRFAQNELLYYRREDPAVRTREELVVLLDQGVRTWGGVRVLLAAAAFALARMAGGRRLALRLATTGGGGESFDPLAIDPGELAERLARSDLSPLPAAALTSLLAEPAAAPRDVVLLTHPLNRDAAETLAAGRGLAPGCRLFALAADRHGAVELGEVRGGAVVPVSRCLVDLDRAAPPPPAPAAAAGWGGDVEPIGYPFLFGLSGHHEPLLFAFDLAGEWLLTLSQPGTLLALRSDGSTHTILPRPMLRGQLVGNFTGVIGVEGGFVVTGVLRTTKLPGVHADRLASETTSAPVAAYYHFPSRSCRVIEFHFEAGDDLRWRYFQRSAALAVVSGPYGRWVRLGAGGEDEELPGKLRWPAPDPSTRTRLVLPAQEIVAPHLPGQVWFEPVLHFDVAQGEVRIDAAPWWNSFRPVEEGRPLLKDLVPVRGECRQATLAALFMTAGYGKQLWLFMGPNGEPIGRLELPISHDAFRLSADGRLLAVQRGHGQVQVRDAVPGLGIRCVTPVGRFHNNLVADLGDARLRLLIGQTAHRIDWHTGALVCSVERTPTAEETIEELRTATYARAAADGPRPRALAYDGTRFRASARYCRMRVVVTGLGEVFLFDENETLVAGFFAFRHDLAAWLPDGTRFGAAALLGQPATPDAEHLVGAALLAASGAMRGAAG